MSGSQQQRFTGSFNVQPNGGISGGGRIGNVGVSGGGQPNGQGGYNVNLYPTGGPGGGLASNEVIRMNVVPTGGPGGGLAQGLPPNTGGQLPLTGSFNQHTSGGLSGGGRLGNVGMSGGGARSTSGNGGGKK